jgi:Nif-specific regulatory protein
MLERYTLVEKELDTLYRVSQVLSSAQELKAKLHGVLDELHDHADMRCGMIALRDPEGDALSVCAVRRDDGADTRREVVRYEAGEGVMGTVLDAGHTVVVERIRDEPRFLGRMGLYEPNLPFIGAPIRYGNDELVGVLAAQPLHAHLLGERSRFLEMVANLIAQSVGALRSLEQRQQALASENDHLRQSLRKNYGLDNIVGHTPAMQKVFELVRQVAKWNTTVLIRGESGTGKELIANAIHYNSARASGPFIKLNCAALPDNLLESELFGHEKGAFSGALSQRKGRFEAANNGTLFLDEIGEVSPAFQAKLLRVLQEGEFERVGSSHTLKVNVRVIAATNRNLEEEVAEGNFREDLFYRLNVMPIHTPALRERLEDIPALAQFLLERISKQQGGRPLELKESAVRMLLRHDWPGNVRELENTLERAAILSADGEIDQLVMAQTGLEEVMPLRPVSAVADIDYTDESIDERERVIAALERCGWVQAKAARLLNMTPRQIAYRVRILNIPIKQI